MIVKGSGEEMSKIAQGLCERAGGNLLPMAVDSLRVGEEEGREVSGRLDFDGLSGRVVLNAEWLN